MTRVIPLLSAVVAVALLAIGTTGILRGPILDSPLQASGLVVALVVSAMLARIPELRIAALPALGIACGIAAANTAIPHGPSWLALAGLALSAVTAPRHPTLPRAIVR